MQHFVSIGSWFLSWQTHYHENGKCNRINSTSIHKCRLRNHESESQLNEWLRLQWSIYVSCQFGFYFGWHLRHTINFWRISCDQSHWRKWHFVWNLNTILITNTFECCANKMRKREPRQSGEEEKSTDILSPASQCLHHLRLFVLYCIPL